MSKIKHQKGLLFAICLLALDIGAAYAKPPVPASAQQHDKNAPIEITSDTLEVFQAENRAVFTGHVVAIQVEDRLKADVMIVYYRKKDEAEQPKKPAQAADKPATPVTAPEEAGAIQKIEAEGHVLLSTPAETASGAKGNYDVDNHIIYLNDHVVLTRGKNVLKGDALTYNLDTGKSVVTSGGVPSADGKKERVHALFVPDKNDKAKKDDKPPAQDTKPQSPAQPQP